MQIGTKMKSVLTDQMPKLAPPSVHWTYMNCEGYQSYFKASLITRGPIAGVVQKTGAF